VQQQSPAPALGGEEQQEQQLAQRAPTPPAPAAFEPMDLDQAQ
jgi:hypothetical protein